MKVFQGKPSRKPCSSQLALTLNPARKAQRLKGSGIDPCSRAPASSQALSGSLCSGGGIKDPPQTGFRGKEQPTCEAESQQGAAKVGGQRLLCYQAGSAWHWD